MIREICEIQAEIDLKIKAGKDLIKALKVK